MNEKPKSDAYAIISLALALFNILDALALLLATHGNIDIINSLFTIGLFFAPIVPIVFGVIGLKSSAKNIAKAGIIISILEIAFKLFYIFVFPLVAMYLFGFG